jgi:hypothetical protein
VGGRAHLDDIPVGPLLEQLVAVLQGALEGVGLEGSCGASEGCTRPAQTRTGRAVDGLELPLL